MALNRRIKPLQRLQPIGVNVTLGAWLMEYGQRARCPLRALNVNGELARLFTELVDHFRDNFRQRSTRLLSDLLAKARAASPPRVGSAPGDPVPRAHDGPFGALQGSAAGAGSQVVSAARYSVGQECLPERVCWVQLSQPWWRRLLKNFASRRFERACAKLLPHDTRSR